MASMQLDVDQYYNDVINALKQDDQWSKFCFLYKDEGRRNDILEFFETLRPEIVVIVEKKIWKEREEAVSKAKEEWNAENNAAPAFAEEDEVASCPFACSVSSLSKDSVKRAEYRRAVLPADIFDGAFVAHKMFVEFVKSSHRMIEISVEHEKMVQLDDDSRNIEEWNRKIDEVTNYGNTLFRHPSDSPNSGEAFGAERPQSMLAAPLIQFAIQQEWERRNKQGRCPILAIHQCELNIPIGDNDNVIRLSSNENNSLSTPTDTIVPSAQKKSKLSNIQQIIDVLIFFPHWNENFGNSIIAVLEYKNDSIDGTVRVAQADMYTTNIRRAYKLPCITVDIAGGQDWNKWIITANAVVPNKRGNLVERNIQRCKSHLYSGQGAEGLCSFAAGVVAAYENYPTEKNDFGLLLGPVVGLHNGNRNNENKRVVKAYVDAVYRKPNLKFVKEFIDDKAKLYSTTNRGIQLLEMKYLGGNCSGVIDVSCFVKILKQLLRLHNYNIVHGDIRLANMIVSSGVLIDFDLAGEQGKATYPLGFQSISEDGKRHEDIEKRLDRTKFHENDISTMALEFNHDYFSMAYVMKLFIVNEPSKQECWNEAVVLVGGGKLDEAIDILNRNKEMQVRLKNTQLATIFGTGATPPNFKKKKNFLQNKS